jgi:hypothetical protein
LDSVSFPNFNSENDISDIGLCLRPQFKRTLLDPNDRAGFFVGKFRSAKSHFLN